MKKIDNISSDFLLSLVTEKNMSLNTASSYRADLKVFFSFLNDQNLNIEIIRKDDIPNFSKIKEKGTLQIALFLGDYLL